MPFNKYVEVEWQEIRLKPFKDWGETRFYLNVATDYPTLYVPKNVNEKLISEIEQTQIEDGGWIIRPKKYCDRILFSGYVSNLLQVAITVLESDKTSLLKNFSLGTEKLAGVSREMAEIPGKLFPFFGISSMVLSGLAALFDDMDDFLGSYIYQLRGDSVIPIGQPMVGQLSAGGKCTGEVDLGIYIKPEESEHNLFYRDVEIFPFSATEIAVYYSGDLANSEQVYMIWTLNNWESNPLIKMKKWGKYWMALIEISEDIKFGSQLEIAFTDNKCDWDNKDGNNWVFEHFRWI